MVLLMQIEIKRDLLYYLIASKASSTDILKVSQELDALILQYYKGVKYVV